MITSCSSTWAIAVSHRSVVDISCHSYRSNVYEFRCLGGPRTLRMLWVTFDDDIGQRPRRSEARTNLWMWDSHANPMPPWLWSATLAVSASDVSIADFAMSLSGVAAPMSSIVIAAYTRLLVCSISMYRSATECLIAWTNRSVGRTVSGHRRTQLCRRGGVVHSPANRPRRVPPRGPTCSDLAPTKPSRTPPELILSNRIVRRTTSSRRPQRPQWQASCGRRERS